MALTYRVLYSYILMYKVKSLPFWLPFGLQFLFQYILLATIQYIGISMFAVSLYFYHFLVSSRQNQNQQWNATKYFYCQQIFTLGPDVILNTKNTLKVWFA